MRYHFDILEDGAFSRDEYGIELVSDEEACTEAQSLAVEIMGSYGFAAEQKTVRVEVRRGQGGPVYAATLELIGCRAHGPAEADEPSGTGLPGPWILPDPRLDVAVQAGGAAAEAGHLPSPAA